MSGEIMNDEEVTYFFPADCNSNKYVCEQIANQFKNCDDLVKKAKENKMENKYLYRVDFVPTGIGSVEFKKQDDKIIYENDEYYYILETPTCVMYIRKVDVISDNGNFKENYYKEKNAWSLSLNKTVFLTEKLRDEFYEACKKYYKIWDQQKDIYLAKERLATSEENTRKEKEYLERLNKELIELNHGGGENG